MKDINKIKCLIFGGGGTNTISQLGVLREFQKNYTFKNIKYVGGSSSGSLHGLFVALNANIPDVVKDYIDTDFNSLGDKNFMYIKNIKNLINKHGFDDGIKFEKWVEHLVKKHLKSTYVPTMKELYERTGVHYCVTATNYNTHNLEYFSYQTQPHLLVSKAIRTSMALPIYFTPVKINNDMYGDGGIINNYIINHFDDVLSPLDVLGIKVQTDDKRYVINSMTDYTVNIIYIGMKKIESSNINENYYHRTFFLKPHNEMNFFITTKEKLKLINHGSDEFRKYIIQ